MHFVLRTEREKSKRLFSFRFFERKGRSDRENACDKKESMKRTFFVLYKAERKTTCVL